MYKKIFFLLIGIILVFFFTKNFFKVEEIDEKISETEKEVLSIFKRYKLKDKNILLRKQWQWTRKKIKGATIEYEIDFLDVNNGNIIFKSLKDMIKEKKDLSISDVYYQSKITGNPEASIDITYNGNSIISIKIKNFKVPIIESNNNQYLATNKNKKYIIALVLDDFGYTKKNLEKIKDLNIKLTMAVLPEAPYSKFVCEFANKNNLEVILHLPMQPESDKNSMETNTIFVDMPKNKIINILNNSFNSVFIAKGISNHMGSLATGNEYVMDIIFNELKKRNMFFLDSFTTNKSVCVQMAKKHELLYARRDLFIDNKMEKQAILEQLKKAEDLVFSKEKIVIIGHDRELTIDVLKEVIPKMKKKGIEFISISRIVQN